MKPRYAVEVRQAALDKMTELGLVPRPSGDDAVSKMLTAIDGVLCAASDAEAEWALRVHEAEHAPIAVATADDIPLSDDETLFVDMATQPPKEIHYRIARRELVCEAICFIGAAPDWSVEHVMAGYKAYQLPRTAVLSAGKRTLEPCQTQLGVRWVVNVVGEPKFQPN